MTTHFAFRWRPKNNENDLRSILVVFSTSEFNEATFITTLDADYRQNLRPDGLVVIVPLDQAGQYEGGLRALAAKDSVLRFDPSKSPVTVLPFDHEGTAGPIATAAGAEVAHPSNILDELKKVGLQEIFRNRDVLVRPGPTLHFVHPNGGHSRGFLRAANALVKGPEVSFIAMTLLAYIKANPSRIWIDSSSIASIAYATVSLKQAMTPGYVPPPIESFSSYTGIDSTRFEHPDDSFFLISATATGRLSQRLVEKLGLHPKQVVTIFSSVKDRGSSEVLCDVAQDERAFESGRSIMEVHPAEACPYCRNDSPLIQFVGDQFLANAITYKEILIVAKHAPRTLASTMRRLAKKGLFRLRETREQSDGHRLWIDGPKLRAEEHVEKGMRDIVRRYVPSAVSHVVHLDDPDSKAFGSSIVHAVEELGNARPDFLAASQISWIDASKAACAVVASACIGSGSSLQDVSRDLRDVFKDKPRIYIGIAAKHAEAGKHNAFQSDLTWNGNGYKHCSEFIHELSLPRPSSLSSWMKEREFIDELMINEEFSTLSGDEKEYFENRLKVLAKPEIGGHTLFLPSAGREELRLRDGFAFWQDSRAEGADQGDVLATIGSVLHHLRTSRDKLSETPEPRISRTEFHCTVLSPGIFGRYNDGVIQAAFLRLAFPHELNFSSRPDLSSDMRRILERCLDRWRDSQGEACPEFLMALATRRLTLNPADIERLRGNSSAMQLPEPEKRLFKMATRESS